MVKFTFKCFVLCGILLIGILVGMQQANQGMIKMKGYNDPDLKSAFQVDRENTGDVEASILGSKVTSQDLQEKQEQLEQIEAFNIFSQIGKQFAAIISNGITILLNTVGDWLSNLLR